MTAGLRAAVITVSTRAAEGRYADETGPAVARRLADAGFEVGPVLVVTDDRAAVAAQIVEAAAARDVVFTAGGTGLHPADVTPEATADVVERLVPGIAEAMRRASAKVTPLAALSRAVAGVRGRCLVVNLPGSVKAASENLAAVLPVVAHAVEQLRGGDHAR